MTATYPAYTGDEPCTQVYPEWYYPQPEIGAGFSRDHHTAKSLCTDCPMRAPCLTWALHHELDGIWGGTTPNERRTLRRRHGIGHTDPVYGRQEPAA